MKYLTPLDIPEGTRRKMQIRHRLIAPGQEVMLSNGRCKVIGGQRGPDYLTYPRETKWHELSQKDRGVWMTDLPIEQRQHDEILKPISHGRVLVGGLGLGYAVTRLAAKKEIREITVVEISQDVIDLVWPSTQHRGKGKVVRSDLHRFLRANCEVFDWAYYDIWQSDGEGTFFDTVVPLLKESRQCVKNRPICWNEDVMRSQLLMGLHTKMILLANPLNGETREELLAHLTTKGSKWINWSIPFFKWVRANPDGNWRQRAHEYVSEFGV